MKKTISIVLILLSISFLSCQNEEEAKDSWTTENQELLMKSCIENSTKEKNQAVEDCDCFVNEIIKETKNSDEFEALSIDELSAIKKKCKTIK